MLLERTGERMATGWQHTEWIVKVVSLFNTFYTDYDWFNVY